MQLRMTVLVLVAAVACLSLCTGLKDEEYGMVTFNMRGVKGSIKFIPLENGSMKIVANLSGFEMKQHGWHVHILPVDQTLPPGQRCSNDYVGGHFDPFEAAVDNPNYKNECSQSNQTACEVGDLSGKFGPLLPQLTVIDNNGDLNLYGRYGIIGRSVKIHGMEDVCGTIFSSLERIRSTTLAHATFTHPFGGTIYFRQVYGRDTAIFGKIFWTADSDATQGHNWHVHANKPSAQYREGNCADVGGHFNPYNVNTTAPTYAMYCNSDNLTACEVGDLSRKHSQMDINNITDIYSSNAFFFQDSFLNVTGDNGIIGLSIAIHNNIDGTIQGCAPIVAVEKLSVSLPNDFIRFSQDSRFNGTAVTSHRSFNNSTYTILSSAIAPNNLCRDAVMAGRSNVYNPHNAPSLDGSDVTPDRYPVGNLSAKHGNIASGGVFTELPIHGFETISDHSLSLAYNEGQSTVYTCRTLQPYYPLSANVKMARATFNGTVTGAIYFTQGDYGNGDYGNTYITVDIWYKNSSMSKTTGHNWHIHVTPPVDGQSCVDSIGGHFNPFNVNITEAAGYKTSCGVNSPLRCESGDLSGKHGVINIGPAAANRETVTFTDSNLNLYGPNAYSIIGRSVGLHLPASNGGALFDCGKITKFVKATSELSVSFSYNQTFNRANFASMLTQQVADLHPSDVLLTSQSMSTTASGTTSCVEANLTVLGASESEANTNREKIAMQFSSLYNCQAAGTSMLLPSVLTLAVGLLIVAFMR